VTTYVEAEQYLPNPTPPDWIDYREAEAALHHWACCDPHSYVPTLLAEHVHHYGRAIDSPEAIEEFATALYSKAVAWLVERGTYRAFGHKTLWRKCRRWAKWRCGREAQRIERQQRRSRGGQTRGRQQQHQRITRAYMAQDWHRKGIALQEIARRLRCAISSVYRYLRDEVPPWFGRAGAIRRPRLSAGSSIQLELEFRPYSMELPTEKTPPPIAQVISETLEYFRRHPIAQEATP